MVDSVKYNLPTLSVRLGYQLTLDVHCLDELASRVRQQVHFSMKSAVNLAGSAVPASAPS